MLLMEDNIPLGFIPRCTILLDHNHVRVSIGRGFLGDIAYFPPAWQRHYRDSFLNRRE